MYRDSTERIMIVDGVEYHRDARDKYVDGAGRASQEHPDDRNELATVETQRTAEY
jgi:hypothetical protein